MAWYGAFAGHSSLGHLGHLGHLGLLGVQGAVQRFVLHSMLSQRIHLVVINVLAALRPPKMGHSMRQAGKRLGKEAPLSLDGDGLENGLGFVDSRIAEKLVGGWKRRLSGCKTLATDRRELPTSRDWSGGTWPGAAACAEKTRSDLCLVMQYGGSRLGNETLNYILLKYATNDQEL